MLRHAKAAAEAPGGAGDRGRSLAGRGRRDATALGKRLTAGEPGLGLGLADVGPPDFAICSSALRTRQTADLVAEAFDGRLPVEADQSLYAAGTENVLDRLRQIDDSVRSALVIGHNPTMFELVWELLAGGDDEGSDRAVLEVHGFPTCALAVLSMWAPSWDRVIPGCASLEGLFRPPY